MVKVAEWSDESKFISIAAKYVRLRTKPEVLPNRTYIVTTIIEEPYIQMASAEPGILLEGNRRYEGYCKDLADLVAERLGINCKYFRVFTHINNILMQTHCQELGTVCNLIYGVHSSLARQHQPMRKTSAAHNGLSAVFICGST